MGVIEMQAFLPVSLMDRVALSLGRGLKLLYADLFGDLHGVALRAGGRGLKHVPASE